MKIKEYLNNKKYFEFYILNIIDKIGQILADFYRDSSTDIYTERLFTTSAMLSTAALAALCFAASPLRFWLLSVRYDRIRFCASSVVSRDSSTRIARPSSASRFALWYWWFPVTLGEGMSSG